MFSLFYGLWKYMFDKDELRVLILGVEKSGKTTLLEKLKSMYLKGEGLPPDRVVPTVGLNIGRIEDANAKLVFWDLGGQAGLRTIWEKYYEEAYAIIYVIDAAASSSFEDAKSALDALPVPDLPGVIADEELARFLHLKGLDDRPYMFQAVSAYDGKGIKFGIDWLVEQMKGSKRTEALRARAAVAGKI
ncbi:hypothetical protein EJB05_06283 [Eragrostis curvula]|uniref:ADP-ribosylation factor-related protein 1 n=1 Tax=Eragrostis curvula TaxID=38414 RepID=A0A5J9WH85_9POAL|nr:hypothetical protein EJB05_06283 [Eragrostis curvula]